MWDVLVNNRSRVPFSIPFFFFFPKSMHCLQEIAFKERKAAKTHSFVSWTPSSFFLLESSYSLSARVCHKDAGTLNRDDKEIVSNLLLLLKNSPVLFAYTHTITGCNDSCQPREKWGESHKKKYERKVRWTSAVAKVYSSKMVRVFPYRRSGCVPQYNSTCMVKPLEFPLWTNLSGSLVSNVYSSWYLLHTFK